MLLPSMQLIVVNFYSNTLISGMKHSDENENPVAAIGQIICETIKRVT